MRYLCAVSSSSGEGGGLGGEDESRVRWMYVKGRELIVNVVGGGFLEGIFWGGC